jgi:hypothetical protein
LRSRQRFFGPPALVKYTVVWTVRIAYPVRAWEFCLTARPVSRSQEFLHSIHGSQKKPAQF